ncbi:MAG: hypothetical protein FWD17_09295, partial [Polyangiaceae bacterium]|nr:hypothetical protein [Polyangiaceae bacterium]
MSTTSTGHGPRPRTGWPLPRVINIGLGTWLFVSAFIWPHLPVEQMNTAVVGALCVFIAVAGTVIPWARYLNGALAVWL